MPNLPTLRRGNGGPPVDEATEPTWPRGWSDSISNYFVEPALRPFYERSAELDMRAGMDAAQLSYPVPFTERARTDSHGRPIVRALDPNGDGEDMRIWQHLQALKAARMRADAQRSGEELATHDRRRYGCACCGNVVPPKGRGSDDAGVLRRRLPDGTVHQLCSQCARIASRVIDDRLLERHGTAVQSWLEARP